METSSDALPLSHYLRDLSRLVLELAEAATVADGTPPDPFQSGQRMAYYGVLTLMIEQAEAFQIPLNALGLEDVDPARYLSPKPPR